MNENRGLDKFHIIERSLLSEEFYFQSLMEQAHEWGLLSAGDIEQLQVNCLDLLAYKTKLFNSGGSSSIRVEKAQDLLNSIMFTIGLWLKTFPNPDDAVTALLTEPLNAIYEKGRKHIDTMLAATKTLHSLLVKQLFDTPNEFYRSTVVDGILGFFKLYYPDFGAQEIHITADYPLFNPAPKLAGIEFIKNYTEAAWYENQFCRYFSNEYVHYLLTGYAKNHTRLLFNIYEPVLTAALGCVITGTDWARLDITREEVRKLGEIFAGRSREETGEIISAAAEKLDLRFEFSHGLGLYIQASLPVIADGIHAASRENVIGRVFFPSALPEMG